MNKRYFQGICLLFFLLLGFRGFSNIRLPSILGSNMVLQQQSEVKLWGWADPGEGVFVTASWSGKTDSVWGSRGARWELLIKTPVAGGPYKLTIKGKNQIILDNILIGEVWMCSGQSNMEMNSVSGVKGMDADLPLSTNPQIRFFHIPKATSQYPQDNCSGAWQSCDSVSLSTFSAVGYYFGKKLHDSLHVPIGLVNASWGGTPAETWAPASLVENDALLKNAAAKLQQTNWWPITPGAAYNGMITPITNFAIAGVIWYQGESNAVIYPTYQPLFTGLIAAWRKAWNKDLPFYYVQIAPYTYGKENISAFLREQQTRSMSFPNSGMAVITDLTGDVNNIHPKNKKDVAARLANWALAETYHRTGFAYKSPVFKNMIVKNGKAEIYFENAPNGFMIKGNKPIEWYIADADRLFLPAELKVEEDRIIVYNKNIKNPVAVRFAFTDTAIGNIFNKEGLPVCPFRTDNW
jgi:sialate O-acetylesterase